MYRQELYGVPQNMLTSTSGGRGEETKEEGDSTLCADTSVDAMFTVTLRGRRQTFVFKGDDYWRLTDGGVVTGYPKKIADRWGGVPGNIDAAFVYVPRFSTQEKLFFLKVIHSPRGSISRCTDNCNLCDTTII